VGTPVGLDKQGSLIPAGIPDGHVFEFDSDDYRTGMFATRNPNTGAAITSAVTEAQMHPNLIGVSGAVGVSLVDRFVRPIGVTSYNVFSHEGGVSFTTWPEYTQTHSNPLNYAQHNTMAQDLVAITCDYCLLVPYVQGKNLLGVATKVFDNSAHGVAILSKVAKSHVFAHDELIVSGNSAGEVGATPLLASGLELVYVSPNCGTDDDGKAVGAATDGGVDGSLAALQFTAPGDTIGTAVDCTKVGLHIVKSADAAKYIVVRSTRQDNGSGPDADSGTGTVTSGTFTFALENPLQPGDHVVARAGKFVKFDGARHEADEVCGQILAVDSDVTDKSYLSRVKSAYERATSPADMMPGSATRGVPFNLHMVTDGAWRQYTKREDLNGTTLSATGLTTPALRLVTINLLK
jgi:hypothetical protein